MPLNTAVIYHNKGESADECYTPYYAVDPLLEFIPKDKIIWCPFDEEWSAFYQTLKQGGYQVVRSSLAEGRDFFSYEPEHWDIMISNPPFSKKDKVMKYNPQFSEGKPYKAVSGKQKCASIIRGGKGGWDTMHGTETISDGKRYPTNILDFIKDKDKLHPTQKPVALLEYLIKTYTDEGDLVLDNCMGSGSTGVAAKNLNRDFIGIELDENYFEIAKSRIETA